MKLFKKMSYGFVVLAQLLFLTTISVASVTAEESLVNSTEDGVSKENAPKEDVSKEKLGAGQSSPAGVYRQQVNRPLADVYDNVYKSLEDARFFVVFEPDIGANLARFSEKWGDDYNRNHLTAIRSMVFCNGWYANKVSNLDPNMLGFCPLHLSLIESGGTTVVLFNRPSVIANNSPAAELLLTIENEVIEAVQKGLKE